MNVVRGCRGGEEQQVGVSGVEAAVQRLGNWLQVHVLDAPHLQARLLSCIRKLFVGNHDGSADGRQKEQIDLDIVIIHVGKLTLQVQPLATGPRGSFSKQMKGGDKL